MSKLQSYKRVNGGNIYSLIIPQAIVIQMGLKKGDELNCEYVNNKIIVTREK